MMIQRPENIGILGMKPRVLMLFALKLVHNWPEKELRKGLMIWQPLIQMWLSCGTMS